MLDFCFQNSSSIVRQSSNFFWATHNFILLASDGLLPYSSSNCPTSFSARLLFYCIFPKFSLFHMLSFPFSSFNFSENFLSGLKSKLVSSTIWRKSLCLDQAFINLKV